MNKKKYLGGLKVFLLLLFTMLLGLCSTSYASISRDYFDFIIDSISGDTIPNISSSAMQTFRNQMSDNAKKTSLFDTINNSLVSNSLSTADDYTCVVFTEYNSSECRVYFMFSNCSMPNGSDLGFLGMYSRNSSQNKIQVYPVNGKVFYLEYYSNNNSTYTAYSSNFYINMNCSNLIFNTDVTVGNFVNSYNYASAQALYYNPNSKYFQLDNGNYTYVNTIVPDIPSGDTGNSGDSGGNGLGNITNSSGDNTGNIDLSPIMNGIENINNNLNNIENKIPTSGDITNALISGEESFWGSPDTLSGEEQEQAIGQFFDDMMNSMSGELSNNPVFQSLETAENLFLNFFNNQEDESYYDLIISWDAISPIISMNNGSNVLSSQSIIDEGSINISALCRDNSTFSQIQQYIRIIFNFSVAIALIWQIYNLILSTLGIDNPFLYEDSSVNDIVNADTGEVHTIVRTRRRLFRKWW